MLLARLHASDAIIGLGRMVQTLGFTLPALFAAHYIHGRARHKPFLIWTCGIGRLGLLTLPPMLLWLAPSRPLFVLVWFFIVDSVFWLLDGASAVSWLDMIAKTIPASARGRFFGTMQTVAGVAAIGAGFGVRRILATQRFPVDFALLAVCWCGGVAISQICLGLIREPAATVEDEPKPGFLAYLRQAAPLLRGNRQLATLVAARLLLDGATMAAPFYVLFARRNLAVALAMVGVYTVVQSLGKVAAGPLWGWIADRHGPVAAMRAVGAAVVATPLLGIAAGFGGPWMLAVAFVLLGAVQDGLWMAGSTVLMSCVSERDRPLAVGVSSVFQTPGALYAVIGGVLAQVTSYQAVFIAALAVSSMGLALTTRLDLRGTRAITDSAAG